MPLAVLVDLGPERFHPVRVGDAVLEADRHRLAAIGGRAAAQAHQQVRAGVSRGIGAGDHGLARAVRGHVVMGAAIEVSQRAAYLLDLIGFPVQGAADQQEDPRRAEMFRLRFHRGAGGLAENHFLHARERYLALLHENFSESDIRM